jgi:hypothetical protein
VTWAVTAPREDRADDETTNSPISSCRKMAPAGSSEGRR